MIADPMTRSVPFERMPITVSPPATPPPITLFCKTDDFDPDRPGASPTTNFSLPRESRAAGCASPLGSPVPVSTRISVRTDEPPSRVRSRQRIAELEERVRVLTRNVPPPSPATVIDSSSPASSPLWSKPISVPATKPIEVGRSNLRPSARERYEDNLNRLRLLDRHTSRPTSYQTSIAAYLSRAPDRFEGGFRTVSGSSLASSISSTSTFVAGSEAGLSAAESEAAELVGMVRARNETHRQLQVERDGLERTNAELNQQLAAERHRMHQQLAAERAEMNQQKEDLRIKLESERDALAQANRDLEIRLTAEHDSRIATEAQLATAMVEMEELSTVLFSQANEMVATERRARARLDARLVELSARDGHKNERLKVLERAVARIGRVRSLLGPDVVPA